MTLTRNVEYPVSTYYENAPPVNDRNKSRLHAKDGVREICNSFSIACYRNELALSIRIDNMNIVIHRLCSSHWFVCLLCLVMKDGGDERWTVGAEA